ncbi:MAG: Unknown protein [uncultured Aureispira sp.]|uniref:DUF7793 domain-containing protein n=1 Tax=uncultured Aureispira sp. TaxID=1331704 RepID=A0A6S6SPF9_9BACT|nr:MAG: Unknown protein [uncultured Aureispira sp.]
MNIDYHTDEFTYTLRPNDIIEVKTHANFDGNFQVDKVEENLRILDDVIDKKPRTLILYFPDKYVSKAVLKKYSTPPKYIVARAFLTTSFASKLIGNLYLTLINRFVKDGIPSKIFSQENEAVLWLETELAMKTKEL